jgi:dihydrofolate reductase
MSRPRCSVFIAASLDGYIARRDGTIDWLDAVQRPGEDYGFQAFFGSVDTLVIGRRTYETALGFPTWPYGGKNCVVMTHAAPPARHGERFHAGDPRPLLERLATEGARRVYVDGGVVIAEFLAAGLIDDLTISVIPVLLGDGARLFGPAGGGRLAVERVLTLVRSQAYPSGLVQLEYRVAIT